MKFSRRTQFRWTLFKFGRESWEIDSLLLFKKFIKNYWFNLKEDEERQKKIAKVKYTYEQVLSAKVEQINAKSNNGTDEIPVTIGRKILQNQNILKIIPDDKESKAV